MAILINCLGRFYEKKEKDLYMCNHIYSHKVQKIDFLNSEGDKICQT